MEPVTQIILGLTLDANQIILGLMVLAGITIPAVLSYKQNRAILLEQKAARLEAALLAKNIDGAMAELKDSIKARGEAEGQLKGAKAEQERVADLIVDPAKVTEAMNGKEVREQINTIEEKIDANTDSIEGVKDAAHAVAEDLAKSHERAERESEGEAGTAADAAARLTAKDKQLLKDDKEAKP